MANPEGGPRPEELETESLTDAEKKRLREERLSKTELDRLSELEGDEILQKAYSVWWYKECSSGLNFTDERRLVLEEIKANRPNIEEELREYQDLLTKVSGLKEKAA